MAGRRLSVDVASERLRQVTYQVTYSVTHRTAKLDRRQQMSSLEGYGASSPYWVR
jgi:hypothetical protein